jgi:hypothetical protein
MSASGGAMVVARKRVGVREKTKEKSHPKSGVRNKRWYRKDRVSETDRLGDRQIQIWFTSLDISVLQVQAFCREWFAGTMRGRCGCHWL